MDFYDSDRDDPISGAYGKTQKGPYAGRIEVLLGKKFHYRKQKAF